MPAEVAISWPHSGLLPHDGANQSLSSSEKFPESLHDSLSGQVRCTFGLQQRDRGRCPVKASSHAGPSGAGSLGQEGGETRQTPDEVLGGEFTTRTSQQLRPGRWRESHRGSACCVTLALGPMGLPQYHDIITNNNNGYHPPREGCPCAQQLPGIFRDEVTRLTLTAILRRC